MKIQFQTGRQYSAHGQRIVAVQEDVWVRFRDHDRGIEGEIVTSLGRELDQLELRDFVMFNYDAGNYRDRFNNDLAWEDE